MFNLSDHALKVLSEFDEYEHDPQVGPAIAEIVSEHARTDAEAVQLATRIETLARLFRERLTLG